MSRFRDRLIDAWSPVTWGIWSGFGALLLVLKWRQQRREPNRRIAVYDEGWERPDD
jgi:hypothetical protein